MAKTEFLLKNQLELILAGLMPDNRRVVQVMLHTGLRVGDVLAIPREGIARQFCVTEQKTKKRRKVGLPDWLADEIRSAAGNSPWAFPSPRDPAKHRTRQAVWKDLKRLQHALHIPVNVGTHTMRKEYAVELRRKYGDLARVQRALQHKDATTTMIYAMADLLTETAQSRRAGRAQRARTMRAVDKMCKSVVNSEMQ